MGSVIEFKKPPDLKYGTTQVRLSDEQLTAANYVIQACINGTTPVAIRGLAGTGKSTLIPYLVSEIPKYGIGVDVGAPTNKACQVLRGKGLTASTIHNLTMCARFTPEYTAALEWVQGGVFDEEGFFQSFDEDPDTPILLENRRASADSLLGATYASPDKGERLLLRLGLDSKDYFLGFDTINALKNKVLIVDEASMLSEADLASCCTVYRHVITVGDPGQLPPVNNPPVLQDIHGIELTQIHRQTAGSKILTVAGLARQGESVWFHDMRQYSPDCSATALSHILSVDPRRFLDSPIIVWRNRVRIAITKQIRKALGYPNAMPVPGEPVVSKYTERKSLGGRAIVNNEYFIVDSVKADGTSLRLYDPANDRFLERDVWIEEFSEAYDRSHLFHDMVKFRFGYAMTCHTAQGGEWPRCHILVSEAKAMWGMENYKNLPLHERQLNRWAYTAATRAKEKLVLVN